MLNTGDASCRGLWLARSIGEGCDFPRGYGIAWRDWTRNRAVCYPVPLNIAAGLLHRLWVWSRHVMVRRTADEREIALLMAYLNGRSDGVASERAKHTAPLR